MAHEASVPPVETPVFPETACFTLEDAVLKAITSPVTDATAAFAEALARLLGARFALLYRGERRNGKRMAGRWADGRPINRPDKLIKIAEAETVAGSDSMGWIVLREADGLWRAGLSVKARERPPGAVLLEGAGTAPWARPPCERTDARRLVLLAAAVIAVGELKEDSSRIHDELLLLSRGRSSAAPGRLPATARPVLEYALSGKPIEGSISQLFLQFPEIVGSSPIIGGVLQSVLTAARSDIPVLIEGESGTGKELVARAIHRVSQRGRFPFVCENCGAVPENLVESEFFGHEKGAFTGAERQNPGVFERARGGTVFLDEVGEMDVALQRKLLRVLQEKEVRRVGGQDTIPVDFRLVSATNRILEDMVSKGKFREDLYYRLNVVTISMPALRERPGDILCLINHFSQLFAEETGRGRIEFTERALQALGIYQWPGNVRELRNEIWGHACSERTIIDVEHLSRRILRALPAEGDYLLRPRTATPPLYEFELGTVGAVIREALRRSRGNRAEAARRLGITRSALYRRMAKYKLFEDAEAKHGPAAESDP